MVVEDGEFVRLYPEIDGEGDDGDGFHCPEDGVSEVPAERRDWARSIRTAPSDDRPRTAGCSG